MSYMPIVFIGFASALVGGLFSGGLLLWFAGAGKDWLDFSGSVLGSTIALIAAGLALKATKDASERDDLRDRRREREALDVFDKKTLKVMSFLAEGWSILDRAYPDGGDWSNANVRHVIFGLVIFEDTSLIVEADRLLPQLSLQEQHKLEPFIASVNTFVREIGDFFNDIDRDFPDKSKVDDVNEVDFDIRVRTTGVLIRSHLTRIRDQARALSAEWSELLKSCRAPNSKDVATAKVTRALSRRRPSK